ncbi:MAG TPA: GFA family protein [Rhizomicrobium sp.]
MTKNAAGKQPNKSAAVAVAQCLCGAVRLEIDYPAFWAWHDHSEASRRAQGCAYATYVGTWRSRFRVVKGAKTIRRFEEKKAGATRSFCSTCGTPLTYERARAPKWVNIPRALFETRTGREPRYHLHLEEAPEWAYRGEKLAPLKGYPGVMWARPGQKKRAPAANSVLPDDLPIRR